ncbi:hypothetical protein STIAU_3013 [Stigmatella aurantiaca DW4/3-1]|uniref:Uncharacterized protein n=1 Tax=Stigmatella aurantiaca (strain DW4/3-1) TaxID=378806 RepID=Q093F0_STIAD|nr:hypothetical protein STIAU_3013 [Stigmatella aurantiaca DW4/3-1]
MAERVFRHPSSGRSQRARSLAPRERGLRLECVDALPVHRGQAVTIGDVPQGHLNIGDIGAAPAGIERLVLEEVDELPHGVFLLEDRPQLVVVAGEAPTALHIEAEERQPHGVLPRGHLEGLHLNQQPVLGLRADRHEDEARGEPHRDGVGRGIEKLKAQEHQVAVALLLAVFLVLRVAVVLVEALNGVGLQHEPRGELEGSPLGPRRGRANAIRRAATATTATTATATILPSIAPPSARHQHQRHQPGTPDPLHTPFLVVGGGTPGGHPCFTPGPSFLARGFDGKSVALHRCPRTHGGTRTKRAVPPGGHSLGRNTGRALPPLGQLRGARRLHGPAKNGIIREPMPLAALAAGVEDKALFHGGRVDVQRDAGPRQHGDAVDGVGLPSEVHVSWPHGPLHGGPAQHGRPRPAPPGQQREVLQQEVPCLNAEPALLPVVVMDGRGRSLIPAVDHHLEPGLAVDEVARVAPTAEVQEGPQTLRAHPHVTQPLSYPHGALRFVNLLTKLAEHLL